MTPPPSDRHASFAARLASYADLAVRVGAGLQPGQRLLVRAPLDAADLVRAVAASAYRSGAPYVDVRWRDDRVTLARLEHASDESLDLEPELEAQAQLAAVERGDAFLSVTANDPELFAGIASERLARMRRASQRAMRPLGQRLMSDAVPWTVVAAPMAAWAERVFSEGSAEERVGRLWDAIFAATRVDGDDAVERWRTHVAELDARAAALSARRYRELRFRAPGTDLRVGLIDGHRWLGGSSHTPSGQTFVPNMPTEEVFTAPHRGRVEGTVRASKPLVYHGQLIEGLELRFAEGRVVEGRAERGGAALDALLATDEGAGRLGEVALVPASSPIARTGLLFRNTLFDENAACHLALGRAYRTNLPGGPELSDAQAAAVGLNDSYTHVDFMIGSEAMDVGGVRDDGGEEAIMRAGEWVATDR